MTAQAVHFIGQITRAVWTGLATAVIMGFLARAATKPQAASADGWTPLRSTIVMVVISVFSAGMALLFAVFSVIAVAVWIQDGLQADGAMRLGLVMGPTMTVMMTYGSAHTFLVRYRFNGEGCERAVLGWRRFVLWEEVDRIHRHWLLGPVLELNPKGRFMLPEYHRGFGQLLEQAAARGIPIDLV